jgi:hypothetical protein
MLFSVRTWIFIASSFLSCGLASAEAIYHPPGSNLTYGDVTHGQRVQSASSNPAAGAADLARGESRGSRGLVFSAAAGLEYGNIENLFEFYNQVTSGYTPSDPDSGGGPGQDPGDKPDDGIDLGDIWDNLDPDTQAVLEAVGEEIAVQAAILSVIRNEGYGRAWLAADVPFQFGTEFLGGAWTFGANWSGNARAFGLTEDLQYDRDVARAALEEWLNTLPFERPEIIPLSDHVSLNVEADGSRLGLNLDNDSSIVTKSSQQLEFNVGYSDLALSSEHGNLFLGVEAHLYIMRLSRLSVRFGDITNSKELFDAVQNADFEEDTRVGFDIGALWVADNYQLGAQITNVNEPKFEFPDINLDPYSSEEIIDFLQQDQTYTMDRQVRLEGSIFTDDRRWSANIGLDVDSTIDPLGDEYQWLTLSAGYVNETWWAPNIRVGLRENLAGTRRRYASIGATLFNVVNLDLASAFDTVEIDGQDLPQGLMVSLGFQLVW